MDGGKPITSEGLAILAIDGIVDVHAMDAKNFDRAVDAAKYIINSRKSFGDYYDRLESDELAMLIVNELVNRKIILQSNFALAVRAAGNEIQARKGMGDY